MGHGYANLKISVTVIVIVSVFFIRAYRLCSTYVVIMAIYTYRPTSAFSNSGLGPHKFLFSLVEGSKEPMKLKFMGAQIRVGEDLW